MKLFRNISILLLTVSLLCSCSNIKKENAAPWGEEEENEVYDLDEILSSGGMIAVTLNGPDTYYDYRGRKAGTQYMLCEKFARFIGVPVRMEVCSDTAELIKKVSDGDADIIACTINPKSDKKGKLKFCGVNIKGRGMWAVNKKNKALADSLNAWYRPGLLDEVVNNQRYRAVRGNVRRSPQPKILDRKNGIISRYDNLFKRYAPSAGMDWHLLAAQCYQESSFDANARSWMGACGLMQIMPETAQELGLRMSDIYKPENNIRAAAKYMSQLQRTFRDIPSSGERIKFALASYNGGAMHIRDAMALAKKYGHNSKSWAEVSRYVRLLSQPKYYNDKVVKCGYMRGNETVGYVNSVMSHWSTYRGI